MSRDRLPLIGSSGRTAVIKSSQPGLQHPPLAGRKKRTLPVLAAAGQADAMTPWGGLSLESSFTSIPPPPPALPAPPPPHAPHTFCKEVTAESLSPSPTASPLQAPKKVPRGGRRRPVSPHRPPRTPRLPPLRPVTDLSFSRSFTFSFFELPLHQSPRCRADRMRHLSLQLRHMQY